MEITPISYRRADIARTLLALPVIICTTLGLWRLGTDLGWAGDFLVRNGLLSHWQIWIGIAGGAQYLRRRIRLGEHLGGEIKTISEDELILSDLESR